MAISKEKGLYNLGDLQEAFSLRYEQLQKILNDAWDDLPVGSNVLDKRRIYTEETLEYIEEHYSVKRKK